MSEPKPYPIDFDKYERGDIVPADELEEASGLKRGTEEYRFWCLNLIGLWKKRLAAEGHGFVSISMKGETIKLMADGQEQLEYVRRGKRIARRMFLNRHLEHSSINPALLPSDEAERMRREFEVDSRMLSLDAPKRKLPPLGSGPEGDATVE